MDILLLYELTT